MAGAGNLQQVAYQVPGSAKLIFRLSDISAKVQRSTIQTRRINLGGIRIANRYRRDLYGHYACDKRIVSILWLQIVSLLGWGECDSPNLKEHSDGAPVQEGGGGISKSEKQLYFGKVEILICSLNLDSEHAIDRTYSSPTQSST